MKGEEEGKERRRTREGGKDGEGREVVGGKERNGGKRERV